ITGTSVSHSCHVASRAKPATRAPRCRARQRRSRAGPVRGGGSSVTAHGYHERVRTSNTLRWTNSLPMSNLSATPAATDRSPPVSSSSGPTRQRRRVRRLLPVVALVLVALLAGAVPGASAGSTPWYEQSDPQSPDSELGVTGAPATGTTSEGEVRGLIDAHTHLMSNEGFGGDIVCGKTFSELGIEDALQDCHSHGSDGRTGLIENLTHLEGKGPLDPHDTDLWPTFADAPKWSSLTHQQMYYRWVERAWRGGLRIMVADTVNNNVLCSLPTQVNQHSCDDMDTVRRQVAKTKELEAFVDERHGGEGKGWFRIAYSPEEARQYVEQGKLAVILGMEVSNPF